MDRGGCKEGSPSSVTILKNSYGMWTDIAYEMCIFKEKKSCLTLCELEFWELHYSYFSELEHNKNNV